MIFHVRPIPSCPGYFVSDTGRIWSKRKERKLTLGRHGRPRFSITVNGGSKPVYLHCVMAEAFFGPKPAGAWVCHRNDIPTDNRLANLYYGNASTNRIDAYRNGHLCTRGEQNGNAKLTWEQVRAIRRQHAAGGVTQAQLAKDHNVTYQAIYQVVHGITWKAEK